MITKLFDLSGKVALVTGASRGLGKTMATGFASAGAHVVVNSRSEENLKIATQELKDKGLSVSPFAFDVTNHVATARAVESILETFGRIDILVNNVGARDRRSLTKFEIGAFEKMLKANLIAPFELARIVAQGMIKNCWGRIINVSSVVSQIAGPGDAIYVATKGGLDAMTRSLSAELGKSGITVNALAPGFFATESNADRVNDKKTEQWLKNRTALGRWATPEELIGPALFLASNSASYVTGHVLSVDGGMLAHL